MPKEKRPPGRFGSGKGGRGGEGPPPEFEEEVIQIDRVTRVVKGGRRLRFRATVVVGNRNGKVGLGIGKSHEVTGAIKKATTQAKKYLIRVPLVKGTIPHEVYLKFKSAKVLIKPASEGTGLIAGSSIRKVLELAGVKNILSKALGASNKITNAKATILAIQQLRHIEKPPEPAAAVTSEPATPPQA